MKKSFDGYGDASFFWRPSWRREVRRGIARAFSSDAPDQKLSSASFSSRADRCAACREQQQRFAK